mmetsp:Transcript_51961/g.161233  ORF Transcript_51961/g.161233 Transcript_51961/m.161233 type:complete len:221 (+) Transcript_51961:240-902(+)
MILGVPRQLLPPPSSSSPMTSTCCRMRKPSCQSWKSKNTWQRSVSLRLRLKSIWHTAMTHALCWPVGLSLTARELMLCASSPLPSSWRSMILSIHSWKPFLCLRSSSLWNIAPSPTGPILRLNASEHSMIGISLYSQLTSTETTPAPAASVPASSPVVSPSPSARMPTKCRRRPAMLGKLMLKSSTVCASAPPRPRRHRPACPDAGPQSTRRTPCTSARR